MRKEESRIRQLAEYGFVSIGLELLEDRDAYQRDIVVDSEWVGGVEWDVDVDYLATLCSDHWGEMERRLA